MATKTTTPNTIANPSALKKVNNFINIKNNVEGKETEITIDLKYSTFLEKYFEIMNLVQAIEVIALAENESPKEDLNLVGSLSSLAVKLIASTNYEFELLDSILVPYSFNQDEFKPIKTL